MFSTTLSILLSIIVVESTVGIDTVEVEFGRFQAKYNKSYASAEEYQHRLACFTRNMHTLLYLQEHDHHATHGITVVMDMCPEELSGRPLSEEGTPVKFCTNITVTPHPHLFPTGFDWRAKSIVDL